MRPKAPLKPLTVILIVHTCWSMQVTRAKRLATLTQTPPPSSMPFGRAARARPRRRHRH